MSIEKTLFSILRQVLSEDEEEVCALDGIDNEQLRRLLYLAQKHEIAHLVAYAYMNARRLGRDEDSKKIRKIVMSAFYQNEQKDYALSEISGAFEELKIPYIPLKGLIVREYYPEAWMRSSCDIDVLIKKEDMPKAIQNLLNLGYTLEQRETPHDCSLTSPTGVHFELHHTLAQEGDFKKVNRFLKNAWDYTVDSVENPYRKNLTNEMFILYHVAHMAKHLIRGGCGIRSFIDLWVVNRKMSFNSEIVENLLCEAGLLTFYHVILQVVKVWFEDEPHNDMTLALGQYVLKGGVYGTMSNFAAMDAVRVDSKIKWFFSLMFVSYKNLSIIYPKLVRYPILYPFYQVKRWFRIFSKDKRENIKKDTNMRNSVAKEKVNATKALLKGLGLIEN